MKIKKATMDDFEEVLKFRLLSKKEELKYSKTLKPTSKSRKYFEKYLRLDLTRRDRAAFIAVENDKIVGAIVGKFFKPFAISKYKKKGYISNLFVDKKHRRRGVAEKLLKRTLKWLKDNKVPYASVEMHIGNIAPKNLFKKLGFKEYTLKMIKKI